MVNVPKVGIGVVNAIKTSIRAAESQTRRIIPAVDAGRLTKIAESKTARPLLTMKASFMHGTGDIVQFTNRLEGMSIEDKIKVLVEKYGIPQETYGLSNMNQIKRMIKMNYPVELAELSYNAEQSIPKCKKVLTQPIFSEKSRGKDLIEWYQKSFENCGSVNNTLREGKVLRGKAKEFQEFFDVHQSILTENTGLIRGSSHLPEIKPGDIITDKGYMSTMTRPGILDVIVEGSAGGDGYYKDFLIIKTKAGQKCIMPRSWGASNAQKEVILPRGTSLRVLDVKALNDNGVVHNGTIITEAIKGRRAIVCEIV